MKENSAKTARDGAVLDRNAVTCPAGVSGSGGTRESSRGGSALPVSPFNIQNPTFKIAIAGVKWLVTFHIVTALWLTFLMPDMASIVAFFKGVFSGKTGFSGPPIFSLVFYGAAVVLYHAWGWLKEHREHFASHLARSPLEPVLHGVMLFLILTNPGAPRGFIYFQF